MRPRTPSCSLSCRRLGSSVSCGSLIEERGRTAATIKAPVGAAPVLFLTRTSRGESQRESKVSPLAQPQRLIYASSQFPAAAANQDVVKVAAQPFFSAPFCHRPRGRGATGGRSKLGKSSWLLVFLGGFFFVLLLSWHNKMSNTTFSRQSQCFSAEK